MLSCKALGHKDPDTCPCGVGVFRRLPTAVTELRCKCNEPDFVPLDNYNIGGCLTVCRKCGQPHIFSVVAMYFRCEGCDKYTTINVKDMEEVPPTSKRLPPIPKYLLCKDCDDGIPTPSTRSSRKAFRFD